MNNNFDKRLIESINNTSISALAEVQKKIADDEVKRNCKQIAYAVLSKANINTEDKSLVIYFSDGHQTNIVEAVANWIYRLNPSKKTATIDDVDEYYSLFTHHLSKNGIDYSW